MVAIPGGSQRIGDMPSGEPIPEGIYYLRCDKAEHKLTKVKPGKPGGKSMVECALTVFGPAEQEEFHGRKIFENFMLEGEGRFRTRAFLEAAGWDEDSQLEDTEQLLNLEVAAVVQIEKERKDPNTQEVFSPRNRIARFMSIEEYEKNAEQTEAAV